MMDIALQGALKEVERIWAEWEAERDRYNQIARICRVIMENIVVCDDLTCETCRPVMQLHELLDGDGGEVGCE